MLNIIDLFSGAGGLTEGFRKDSFNLLAHVEMDKSASKTLKVRDAYHYLKSTGNLTKYRSYIEGKISYDEFLTEIPEKIARKVMNIEISEETLPKIFKQIDSHPDSNRVHGIIGGPPCQAYSTIGRARNAKIKKFDERIYLYKYYLKFLEKYNPDFFVFENVKGLISFKDSDGNNLLDKIKYDFTNIISSNHYHIQIKLINCADFGVPQVRERLFIFGYKTSMKEFNFFKSLNQFQEKPPIVNELFHDLPKLKAGETKNKYSKLLPSDYVLKNLRSAGIPLSQNICRPNNENDLKIYSIVAKEKKKDRNVKYSDLPSELITHKKSDIFLDRFKAINGNGFSHTVVAHIAKDGHYYIHPDVSQNRSITVREAARIQTFPDDFYFEDSRTAAFKQIGNAVPPHFSNIISQNILENLYKK
jgi:DNA (cytosine-5)-methyltransferase 1